MAAGDYSIRRWSDRRIAPACYPCALRESARTFRVNRVVFKRLFGREDLEESEREDVKRSLQKSKVGLLDRIGAVLGPVDITPDTWDELEALLIQSDVGATTSTELVSTLREQARDAGLRRADEVPRLLRHVMVRALEQRADQESSGNSNSAQERPAPWVVLVVGVNGGGKTTTTAKLAHRYKNEGMNVVLVAADTFRAAAIDQLAAWGETIDVPVIRGMPGGDPAAVVHDALASSAARSADIVIVDTAGRLHNQRNLMRELEKVSKVADRAVPGAPHEVLLVLDATTGQNGLAQAKVFAESVAVDGLALAKLDSSARGGVAFAITRELGLPIRWVGTGEAVEDIAVFDAASYASGLLGFDVD